jgi:toxin ParE1/3/4
LQQIEEYIAQDNPIAAVDTVLNIIRAVEYLVAHPSMGRVGRIFDTRELIVSGTQYIVVYQVMGNRINILRVLHAAMQWPSSL